MTKRQAREEAVQELIAVLHAHADDLADDNLVRKVDRDMISAAFNKLVSSIEQRLGVGQ